MRININKETVINLSIAIIFVTILGVVGSLLTDTNSLWYQTINKPSVFVPTFLFPVVWTIIYALFAFLIFKLLQNKQLNLTGIILFILNAIMQLAWSLTFFKINSTLSALFIIVILLFLSIMLSAYIYRNNKYYGYALTIYPIWVFIATMVNAAIWAIN